MIVVGEIGKGKSSLVKAYLHRQVGVFGRRGIVISPKRGEYDRLAEAFAVEPIRLRPGGALRLNPLDATDPEARARAAIGAPEKILDRPLRPAEDAALAQTLAVSSDRVVTLPRVVHHLLNPTADAWKGRWRSADEWLDETRECALSLDRLVSGAPKGMFDAETRPKRVARDAAGGTRPLGRLGLRGDRDSHDRHARLGPRPDSGREPTPITRSGLSSAMRPGACSPTSPPLKRCSTPPSTAAPTASSQSRSSTRSATSPQAAMPARASAASPTDCSPTPRPKSSSPSPTTKSPSPANARTHHHRSRLLPHLKRGEALWRIGTRSALVTHHLSTRELEICDTDQRMRATPEAARA